jgi:hypothetical protein
MKNLRILQLLLLCSFMNIDGYSQNNREEIVTSVPKTRVFYAGLDNELNVSPANTIVNLSSPGGSISKKGDGKYVVRFLNPGIATIEFVSKTQTQRINFPIKRVPDPKIVFCGQSGGNITKDNINKCSQLDVDMHDFIYDGILMDIIRFDVIIIKSNKINNELAEPFVFQNKGKVFSSILIEELKKLNNGDIVIFEEIILLPIQEMERKLNEKLTFVIEKK